MSQAISIYFPDDDRYANWSVLAICQELRDELDRTSPECWTAPVEVSWQQYRRALMKRFDGWSDDPVAPEYGLAMKALTVAALNLKSPYVGVALEPRHIHAPSARPAYLASGTVVHDEKERV